MASAVGSGSLVASDALCGTRAVLTFPGWVLEISQQTMNAYEMGHRRVPVSALTLLARTLGVSVEELLGADATAAKKRGPAPKLQQQIERIQQLPRPQQKFVMQMLDTVLQQAGR